MHKVIVGLILALVIYALRKITGMDPDDQTEKVSPTVIDQLPEILAGIPLTITLTPSFEMPDLYTEILYDLDMLADGSNPIKNVDFLIKLGNLHYAAGEYTRASDLYDEALAQARLTGHTIAAAVCFSNLGVIYTVMQNFDNALLNFTEALKYTEGMKLNKAKEKTSAYPDTVPPSDTEIDRSIDRDRESLRLYKYTGFQYGQADSLEKIGDAHAGKGAVEMAVAAYEEALAIHRKIGDHSGEANDLLNIGMMYKSAGYRQKALSFLEEALRVLDRHNLSFLRDRVMRAIDEVNDMER